MSEGGNGHRYVRTPEPCLWAEAVAWAQSLGGHLVTISSQAENDWVWPTFGGPDHDLWMGLSDFAEEGRWVWTSGEPVTYTNWDPGEPNNLGGEDYGNLFKGGIWNDTNQHNWGRPVYGVIEIEPGRGKGAEGSAPGPRLELVWTQESVVEEPTLTRVQAQQAADIINEHAALCEPVTGHPARGEVPLRPDWSVTVLEKGELRFQVLVFAPPSVDPLIHVSDRRSGRMYATQDKAHVAEVIAAFTTYRTDRGTGLRGRF